MLKKIFLIFPLLVALSTNVTGQAYKAYGGYMVGLWSINWTSLNLQSKPEYGMGKFEKAIFLNGGGGAVNVYDRIYIGGAGFIGNIQINGADTASSTINRTLSLSSNMVGPYLEANYRPYGNLELNLGAGIYFGETSLNVIKDSGTKSWSNKWNAFAGGANPSYVTNKISTAIRVNHLRAFWCLNTLLEKRNIFGWRRRGQLFLVRDRPHLFLSKRISPLQILIFLEVKNSQRPNN